MVLYYFMILWQVRLGFLDRKKIMLGFDCSNYFGFKRPYFRGSVHRKHPVSILFSFFHQLWWWFTYNEYCNIVGSVILSQLYWFFAIVSYVCSLLVSNKVSFLSYGDTSFSVAFLDHLKAVRFARISSGWVEGWIVSWGQTDSGKFLAVSPLPPIRQAPASQSRSPASRSCCCWPGRAGAGYPGSWRSHPRAQSCQISTSGDPSHIPLEKNKMRKELWIKTTICIN